MKITAMTYEEAERAPDTYLNLPLHPASGRVTFEGQVADAGTEWRFRESGPLTLHYVSAEEAWYLHKPWHVSRLTIHLPFEDLTHVRLDQESGEACTVVPTHNSVVTFGPEALQGVHAMYFTVSTPSLVTHLEVQAVREYHVWAPGSTGAKASRRCFDTIRRKGKKETLLELRDKE